MEPQPDGVILVMVNTLEKFSPNGNPIAEIDFLGLLIIRNGQPGKPYHVSECFYRKYVKQLAAKHGYPIVRL